MAKKVLGRGLGAFFPDYQEGQEGKKEESGSNPYLDAPQRVNMVAHLPVVNIRANPQQPRKDFDELKLQELAESIRQHGLIQPITVRQLTANRFELISGERRLRATIMAGIESIPAYIREADDEQSLTFALIENVQREELNPIEIALGYQRLIEECTLTQEQVAERVGKSRPNITNFLRLLQLPALIQSALKQGKISNGHARSLITVEDRRLQEQLLEKTIREDFSVRQLEDAVRRINQTKKDRNKLLSPKQQADIELKQLTERLTRQLSTKVDIKKKTKGGEIRIEYYSDDELERLLNLFEHLD